MNENMVTYRFSPSQVDWRPSATNSAKTKALAGAYVDIRHIQSALDELAPGWNSTVTLQRDANEYYATVHIRIGESIRGEVGSGDTPASASNQAFRRAACAFGLGRYLWLTPSPWEDFVKESGKFTPDALKRLRESLAPLSKSRYIYMHELGRAVFDAKWDNGVRANNTLKLTNGRTGSTKELTPSEMERMIAGLEIMVQNQPSQLKQRPDDTDSVEMETPLENPILAPRGHPE